MEKITQKRSDTLVADLLPINAERPAGYGEASRKIVAISR